MRSREVWGRVGLNPSPVAANRHSLISFLSAPTFRLPFVRTIGLFRVKRRRRLDAAGRLNPHAAIRDPVGEVNQKVYDSKHRHKYHYQPFGRRIVGVLNGVL